MRDLNEIFMKLYINKLFKLRGEKLIIIFQKKYLIFYPIHDWWYTEELVSKFV